MLLTIFQINSKVSQAGGKLIEYHTQLGPHVKYLRTDENLLNIEKLPYLSIANGLDRRRHRQEVHGLGLPADVDNARDVGPQGDARTGGCAGGVDAVGEARGIEAELILLEDNDLHFDGGGGGGQLVGSEAAYQVEVHGHFGTSEDNAVVGWRERWGW